MNKTFLLACFLIFLIASEAVAQQSRAIKAAPLSVLLGTAYVAFEQSLNQRNSIELAGAYTDGTFKELAIKGYGATAAYYFYFSKETAKMEGWYAGPYLRYQHLKFINTDQEAAMLNNFSLGGIIGHQFHVGGGQNILITPFVGLGYNIGLTDSEEIIFETETEGFFNGLGVRGGFTVGYAF